MLQTAVILLLLCLHIGNVEPFACDSSSFPIKLDGIQYMGLHQANATSAAECIKACCDAGDTCKIWQWADHSPAHPTHSCWIGSSNSGNKQDGWTSQGRDITPPTPAPTPKGPFKVDDSDGLGMHFEGIGAISGGGATSKLLMDYSPKVRSDILDYLFKPNFGLSLHILKVELGGDSDATEGAEPSHMHFEGDENYERGYEWWLMKEAKNRNPKIQLYGLPWAWPGWLGIGGDHDTPSKSPFTHVNKTANYTLNWLLGGKKVHGLDIDYVGLWNERSAPSDYVKAMQQHLNMYAPTVQIRGGPHYPGTSLKPADCTGHPWNATMWVDEEGSVADMRSARCLTRCINRNYLTGCHTATFQWHLISSFYDYLPWKRCGVAVANTPWSGFYEVTSPTWAVAHTTQFAFPGWRHLLHGKGVGFLEKGGSFVTRTNGKEFSIVVEKMAWKPSACARGSNPQYDASDEDVVFILGGNLSKITHFRVWYSNLTDGSSDFFQAQPDIAVKKGSITLRVRVGDVFTLTTLDSSFGLKGNHTPSSPSAFPVPYLEDFESSALYSPPKYFYDQMGAWEIQQSTTASKGKIMRQVVPIWPVCWGYSCSGPTTYFGDNSFGAVTIIMDVLMEDECQIMMADLSGKLDFKVSTNGTWSFGKDKGTVSFPTNKWHLIGVMVGSSWSAATLNGHMLSNNTQSVNNWSLKLQLSRYVNVQINNFNVTHTK